MHKQPILFYDGECGLCHRFVLFVLKREPEPLFLFAPLFGDAFKEHFNGEEAPEFPDSLVLMTEAGDVLTLSDAAIYVLKTLNPCWRRTAKVIGATPKPIRDFGYKCVAAVRKKIFEKPQGVCPLVPPEMAKRFIG